MLWTLTLIFWYSKHYSWFVLFCFVFVLFFVFRISSLNVIYHWITIFNMGYSKHQLSTKKHVVLTKEKFCHITPLPPHNGQLFTTATFFYPQGGCCGKVFIWKRKSLAPASYPDVSLLNKLWSGTPSRLMEVCQQVLYSFDQIEGCVLL